jgi:hypothetical protein
MTGLRFYALWQGDEGGDLIHISLVHAANLFGFHLWQTEATTFCQGTEDHFRALAEESLVALENETHELTLPEVATRIQVYCIHAGYHFYAKKLDAAREYLSRAADVVSRVTTVAIVKAVLEANFGDTEVKTGPFLEARSAEEGTRGSRGISSITHSQTTAELIATVAQLAFMDRSISLMLDLDPILDGDFENDFMDLKVGYDTHEHTFD